MSETYTHSYFLTYKQTGEFDYSLGETDLFYSITVNQLTLVSKPKDGERFVTQTLLYPITSEQANADIKAVLSEFLTVYLSKLGYGYPWFVKSGVFTESDFNKMVSNAIEMIDARKSKARLNTCILTDFCKQHKLNPEPCNESGTSWQANCPSGRGHWIAISTESNTWGCGYCRKKGGIPELMGWIIQIKGGKKNL